jgi:hypothetical protein
MSMCDNPSAPGRCAVEGFTEIYTQGDSWTTDDNFELYYTNWRPATLDEIDLA